MSAMIAGILIAAASLYLYYYCNRHTALRWAAKRLLIHDAGIVAMELAELKAREMVVRLDGGA